MSSYYAKRNRSAEPVNELLMVAIYLFSSLSHPTSLPLSPFSSCFVFSCIFYANFRCFFSHFLVKIKNVYGACIRKRISSHFYDDPWLCNSERNSFFENLVKKIKEISFVLSLALVQFRVLQSTKQLWKTSLHFFRFHILLRWFFYEESILVLLLRLFFVT